MTFFLLLAFYSLISFLGAWGKKEAPARLIESDDEPPIFGSWGYDPVRRVFDVDPPTFIANDAHTTDNMETNNSTYFSTKTQQFLWKQSNLGHSRIFRKHVVSADLEQPVTSSLPSKLLQWWTKPTNLFLRNATKSS